MGTVASYALGCKVNQYESEAIAELFEERGYNIVDINERADIYIINTCTVTNFGDKKSRQLIRKVKRQNKDSILVVVGCYAQASPEEISNIEGINIIVGTKNKSDIVDIVENYKKEKINKIKNYVTDIMEEKEFEYLKVNRLNNKTRAYIKIQDGCNQFCSYCIIPYVRGPIRSRNINDIINEVKILSKNGFKEIVLTGIHIASYGKDIENSSLLDVVKLINNIDGVSRIRFSSLEPTIITDDFVKSLSQLHKVCNHFHLSLQSGCDKTLKEMNRKYDTKKYSNSVRILRKYIPDVAITTDIIVGFPGETDYDFEESYNFAKSIDFTKIHIFPYSPKKGTLAAKRDDQILNSIKQYRVKKFIELDNLMYKNFINKYINKKVEVLFEKSISNNFYEGYTKNYIKVFAKSDKNIQNQILNIYINGIKDNELIGFVE